jgi:hypothetical protein
LSWSAVRIPLSHLSLDLAAPAIGWAAYLAEKGMSIVLDDLGRAALPRGDARTLFVERAEAEARKREAMERIEQEAVEADARFRAQLWQGVPADLMPPGLAPAAVMLQADKDAQPRRQSVLEEALSNSGGLTFHSLAPTQDEGGS